MRTDEMVARVKGPLLNRPDEDDLFLFPDDYYGALTQAANWVYRKIAAHYPELLYQTTIATTEDGGQTYALPDDHHGEIEIWTPPGPPRGYMLYNVLPDSAQAGFYLEGRKIVLTFPQLYAPGLYIRWMPASVPRLNDQTNSPLPVYCDEMVCLRAAYELAGRPGFGGNPDEFRVKANREWAGDSDDPSDTGILGILSRQAATQGNQTASDGGDGRWWRAIR